MAKRIIFLPSSKNNNLLFIEKLVDFEWVPGMAITQARKSIKNLHTASRAQLNLDKILEISTRSDETLGVALSAFNLCFDNLNFSIESVYQSSKVFERGGPYIDLLNASSRNAKSDDRLKTSGGLVGFRHQGNEFPVTKAPNFYDYLYIRGLLAHDESNYLINYEGFTDIAFSQISLKYNKKRSYNCQARSAAIFVTLLSRHPKGEILNNLVQIMQQGHYEDTQLDLF